MGSRDYRHHETKKPRKDARKAILPTATVEGAPPPPEVVKRKRKERPEEV